ncbi:serine endoprotease DegQ [Acidihalobacter aeolianus]|uniref:Serine endoprotease DegQ n=2 Tax=Acidihalobacter aeolianus TaxID=2792603 RepID=A0A1D8KBK4_9GAMM|nr:serine endoprotease DegQ [Acidihalobacter aeolianus]
MPRMLSSLLCAALAGAVCLPAPARAELPPVVDGQRMPSLAPMLSRIMPAVVNISVAGEVAVHNPLLDNPAIRRYFGLPNVQQEQKVVELSSGVIVNAAKGYILTNSHDVANAEKITVTLRDGRQYTAHLVGRDKPTDIAVLQIQAHHLRQMPLGDSSRLRVGDYVVAIGNPFGLGQTVTSGIVSALGRSGLGLESYEDFIQTDAPINPGNSGGALVNLRGQLVGIDTAILGPNGGSVGIGFAIPVDMAVGVMDQLIKYGRVERGRIGIAAQDLTPALASAFGLKRVRGAVIAQVEPGLPAARAGIRPGDIVVGIDGRAVRDAMQMRNILGLERVGTTIRLSVLRHDRPMAFSLVVARPAESVRIGGRISPLLAGATLGDVPAVLAHKARLHGVIVLAVRPDSPAARSGLQKGDVIESVNLAPIRGLSAFAREVHRHAGLLLFNVRRGHGALFLTLGS